MIAHSLLIQRSDKRYCRRGIAAVEFAVCLPVLMVLVLGLWEMGRWVEVQQVAYNSVREGARDASMGQANLQAVAANILLSLQNAEPNAFKAGDATSFIAPVIGLAANTFGYTCWDNTLNQELFTFTFTDVTNPLVTDPTAMAQLDIYTITISYPVTTVTWVPLSYLTGIGRYSASTTWACLVDSPFQLGAALQAQ